MMTWVELHSKLMYGVKDPRARQGSAIVTQWCEDNLPELDRVLAMEKIVESQRDEIDLLVRQLKGE
jgi:hypothetical protein